MWQKKKEEKDGPTPETLVTPVGCSGRWLRMGGRLRAASSGSGVADSVVEMLMCPTVVRPSVPVRKRDLSEGGTLLPLPPFL